MADHAPVAAAPARDPEQVLRRLEWTVLRRLDGELHGDYRTLFRGAGLDLADLREYQYHDDVRHIDWNVTARLQTPYVREFHEDREVSAWFLVDRSASVDFGSGAASKQAIAGDFVASLARVLTRRGNRVGAVLYGTQVDHVIPPRSGRRHVLHLLQKLLARPAAAPARGARTARGGAAPAMTDLGELLRTALQVIKRRSLVFIVSDFISMPGWDKPLAMLAQRHEVIAVRLYDDLEMELPDLGYVLMQDAETGEQVLVDTHAAGFRKRFAALATQRETALHEALGTAGVDALELATDDDIVTAVLRFADLRRQRRQLSQGGVLAVTRSRAADPSRGAAIERESRSTHLEARR
jgi:uncharacterized protein (DUF58 family)